MNAAPSASLPADADGAALATLVQHWIRFPAASDDVEGIARFWLQEPVLGQQRAERALALLSDAGFVQAKRSADGRIRWLRRPGPSDAQWRAWLRQRG